MNIFYGVRSQMVGYATRVAALALLLTTVGCDKKPTIENVAPLPALPMWIKSTGSTQSGAMIDVTHPFTWRAAVATPTSGAIVYNTLTITPDSGVLTLALPDQSGLFVFGMDSTTASTTVDAFIKRKIKSLTHDALRADTARTLSSGVQQADLRTADGSKIGIMHVTHQTNSSPALWRIFLGDAEGNALAMQIAIDSLKVRNK